MTTARLALAALALAALGLTACTSGPHARFGYATVEKDGRLYVFAPQSASHQRFLVSGDAGKTVTYIGEGPDGMTLIVEDGVDASPFMAAPASDAK